MTKFPVVPYSPKVRDGVFLKVAGVASVFIALSLLWGIVVDGFRPDRWDLLGTSICLIRVLVMVAPPRG